MPFQIILELRHVLVHQQLLLQITIKLFFDKKVDHFSTSKHINIPHITSHISHLTSHILHLTFHISHFTSHTIHYSLFTIYLCTKQYCYKMEYQTYPPHPDLAALVQCYWTLEVPADINAAKQRIIPDGCIEMAFILGDDIKRYTTETDFILQPRAMVLGQTIEPFYIQPTGHVNTFAIRFYPYGFANFITTPINNLANKETLLNLLFGEEVSEILENKIIQATKTADRIAIIESFLLDTLNDKTTIDKIVETSNDAMISTSGNTSINSLVKDDLSKRRQLERKFKKQIGISPKQLGKVIRLQAALKMLLNKKGENLTHIAYENEYYDQAHFIRDFKEFTGITPSEFGNDETMQLSSRIYKN